MKAVAPVGGTVIGLGDVPDPVFAEQIVGAGIAIDPTREKGVVVAPVEGTLLKLHPHAFIVLTVEGKGVLVHLGIDTVQLEGEGFELIAAEGTQISAGDPVVRWDPAAIESGGRSPIVPVVVMDSAPDSIEAAVRGLVGVGAEIFSI